MPSDLAVHVRKGDFIGTIYDILNKDYYLTGIQFILEQKKNSTFFFFSNDIQWIHDNIIPFLDKNIIYHNYLGNNDTGWKDMYLMSICNSIITSNSGFSWVPAWLIPEKTKIVILPKKWLKDSDRYNFTGLDTAFNIKNCVYL